MPVFIDQLGRSIQIAEKPSSIISLVPSQTELLYHLGLEAETIGITKFCIHPNHWFTSKQRIGGTKKIQLEKIHTLQPDLIIANKEENEKAQIEELSRHYPVWISDISNLSQALDMIRSIANITGRTSNASTIIEKIESGFAGLPQIPAADRPTCAYLIWKNPWMTIGADCFIHDMLERCGLKNVFADSSRYPKITIEDLKASAPDLVWLSSEPYPFKEKDLLELQSALPKSTIQLVDGELFSWYGSRLIQSPPYFQSLLQALASR